MRLLAIGVVLAAATTAPAGAHQAACGRATAQAAITATHLRMKLLGDTATRVDPSSADQVICFDFTRDGRLDVAVSIASGGTAGDIGFVVFRRTASGWGIALTGSGYKLGLFRLGGDVATSLPVYRKNDPNCCPTGGFDHARYRWSDTRFAVARRWHTRTFRP
ncbi:MAG TPA: hypothetical protein VJT84_06960 [Gaiellaceae bacterium]|nr:hypothetical protein [Gaiellaceae bacterium]